MNILTKLGLVEGDDARAIASAPPARPAYVPMAKASASHGDAEMVGKLKASILSASPILAQFMANIEIVRPQFPGDEPSALKAALAFTRVDKNTLLHELTTTVAASLAHAKSSVDTDRKNTLQSATGELNTQLVAAQDGIRDTQAHMVELQSALADKTAEVNRLQAKIKDIEAGLARQDDTVKASFADVEHFISALGDTFSKL